MEENKSKNNKMVFVYGIIMLVCVAVIVIVGLATGPRHNNEIDAETQTLIDEKQNSIRLLEEKVVSLEKEVKSLTVEKNKNILKIEELEKQLQNQSLNTGTADAVTLEQAMADLKDIYNNFKKGNVKDAKTAFSKIEPMGYDDATLAYYEILKDVIENAN